MRRFALLSTTWFTGPGHSRRSPLRCRFFLDRHRYHRARWAKHAHRSKEVLGVVPAPARSSSRHHWLFHSRSSRRHCLLDAPSIEALADRLGSHWIRDISTRLWSNWSHRGAQLLRRCQHLGSRVRGGGMAPHPAYFAHHGSCPRHSSWHLLLV